MTTTRRPATTRQQAVQPACFLKRPRVFARSAGCQHRLHPQAPAILREPHGLSTPPASPSARASSRAPPAVNTACILKRSRPFASHTGCQHRLHPPAARACSPPIQVSRLEHHLLAAQRLPRGWSLIKASRLEHHLLAALRRTRRLELTRRPSKPRGWSTTCSPPND